MRASLLTCPMSATTFWWPERIRRANELAGGQLLVLLFVQTLGGKMYWCSESVAQPSVCGDKTQRQISPQVCAGGDSYVAGPVDRPDACGRAGPHIR